MELVLKEKEMVDLSEGFRNYRVSCGVGSCWLTREGDSRDLVMRPGMEILVEGRNVIITALTDVTLKLVAEKAPAACDVLRWKNGWVRTGLLGI